MVSLAITLSYFYKKILYQLPVNLKSIHDLYESGKREFPIQVVPPLPSDQSWSKHNPWDTCDPVSNKWISSKLKVQCMIYKESMTIADKHRTVYYRPTKGDCCCQLFYDGQEDLLFSIDNRHLFYYGFLFQYLHSMVEGRNPLASYVRSCERTLAT